MSKTLRPFSAIAVDQAHEQNNKQIKDRGGAVGLTHDPSALRRVMIAGPEVSRLIGEYMGSNVEAAGEANKHHEQYQAFQDKFKAKCVAMKSSYLEHENPFLVTGPELIVLDSRAVVGSDSVRALYCVEATGFNAYKDFVEQRLVSKQVSFYAPIKKVR